MAGLTLRLDKSVNGIGNSMTLPTDKLIENVVRRIVPRLGQALLGQPEPRFAFVGRTRVRLRANAFKQL
jgi:hypothetical protein